MTRWPSPFFYLLLLRWLPTFLQYLMILRRLFCFFVLFFFVFLGRAVSLWKINVDTPLAGNSLLSCSFWFIIDSIHNIRIHRGVVKSMEKMYNYCYTWVVVEVYGINEMSKIFFLNDVWSRLFNPIIDMGSNHPWNHYQSLTPCGIFPPASQMTHLNLLHLISIISKVGDRSRGWPEGSLFDSYYTHFAELLHFTNDPYLIMLSVKQGGIQYHFKSL